MAKGLVEWGISRVVELERLSVPLKRDVGSPQSEIKVMAQNLFFLIIYFYL
jgi:hypothetical protein